MKLICLAMLLFLWVSPISVTSNNVVLRVEQKAFDFVSQTQRELLQESFSNISIPDPKTNKEKECGRGVVGRIINKGNILGVGHTLVGKVMNLNEVKIHHVKLPKLAVKLVPEVGLHVCIDTDFKMSGKHAIFGETEIKVRATVLADIEVSKTSKGVATLAVTDCKPIIQEMDITFGLRFLHTILWTIQGHIREMLGDRLCQSVSTVLEGVNEEFDDSTEKNLFGDDLGLQYSLQNRPMAFGGYMDIDLIAKYTVKDQVVELPNKAQNFTLPPGASNKDAMINMGFSKAYFSSLFMAFVSSGGFNLEIPSTYVSSRYPQPLRVDMKIVLSQTPVVTFQSKQLILQISPHVEMFVVVSNSPYRNQHLLTVNVVASLVAALDVEEEKLKTSVSLQGDLNLVFVSVSFGKCKCNPSLLSEYIRTVFEKAYLPHINDTLSVGVPLPKVPNIQFIEPVVKIEKNYAAISSNVQYTE
uniref:Uncharacterized protein n=1 Tax=Leptobrachium leishanense TaxID=445787 RepID=A0A8C5R3B1_9ANUR